MRWSILLFIPVLTFLLLPEKVLAGEAVPVVIAQDPGGAPAAIIPLRIAPDANSTSTTLYMRQRAETDQDLQVRFSTALSDAEGVRQTQVAIGLTALVPISGTTGAYNTVDALTTPVRLPGDGSSLRLDLSVSNLREQGTFSGTLNIEVNGRYFAGPQLSVMHYPKPQLRVVGAKEDGFAFQLPTPSFNRSFLIESLNQSETVLRIQVDPFVGPDGAPVVASWTIGGAAAQEVRVAGLESATVSIVAMLPLTGTYSSGLTLIYNQERQTTRLVVNRTRPVPPVMLNAVATTLTDLGCPASWYLSRTLLFGLTGLLNCLGTGNPSVWLSLTSTSAQTETLEPPTLIGLTLQGANGTTSQARFTRIVAQDPSGQMITPTLVLAPGATQQMRVTVLGLHGAGEYNGVLQVKGANTQPLERSIQILAREGWWVAVTVIGLGILLSTGIRLLARVVRPRLATQARLRLALRRFEELEQELGGQDGSLLDAAEQKLLVKWARAVRAQYDLAFWGHDQNSDAMIKQVEARISRFSDMVNLRRQIDALQPTCLQPPLRQQLDAIRSALTTAATDADFTSLDAQIGTLQTAVDETPSKWLDSQITMLTGQVTALQVQQADLVTQKQDVVTQIQQARDELNQNRVESARQTYEQARYLYARLLIDALWHKLDDSTLPAGFADQADWDALRNQGKTDLGAARQSLTTDPEQAIRQYERVYATYLSEAILRAKKDAEQKRSEMEAKTATPGSTEEKEKNRQLASLQAAEQALDEAQQQVKAQNLNMASTQYEDARKQLEAIGAAQQRGVFLGHPTAKTATSIGPLAAALPGGVPEPAPGATPIRPIARLSLDLPTVQWLNWSVVLVEAVLAAAVFVVAVLLGLNLLWVNSLTWGGWGAYVVAFLWGLGLHQISGQAFVGIMGLREQIAGAAPPGGA